MGLTHPKFTAQIAGDRELIFNLLADMPNYGCWLTGSQAFGGTTEVKPYPVQLGTTYLDGGPDGERPGEVTAYEPPERIAFHHTMALKKGPLTANIDAHIHYLLQVRAGGTLVNRDLDLTVTLNGIFKLAMPLVLYAFKKENIRILAELKRYVEGGHQ